MILGPVFRHELRAAGRKRRYFHARVVIGVLLLGVLWMVFEGASFDAARVADGRLSISGASFVSTAFFQSYARLTLWGVLLVTPAVAAGAIASERERRTIEYLFASDLSNAEIVLDKLLARLMTIGKLLLATLPVLAIFRLLGGVPGELLLAHFALLAATAAVSASLALCVGAHCERARDAVPQAMGWTVAWLVASPVSGLLLGAIDRYLGVPAQGVLDAVYEPVVWFASATNPILVLESAAGMGGGALGVDFDARAMAAAIGAMLLLAATLLTLCTLVVRRVHLRSAGRGAGPVKAERTGKAVTLRTPSDRRPLVWKEMHAASIRTPSRTWRGRAIRVAGWLLVVGVSVTPVVFFWLSLLTFGGGRGFGGRTPTLEEYVATTATIAAVLGSLTAIGAGARASGLIAHERERDTWLTLLTTPATASDIFYAKLIGNLWAFRWPAALVVALPTLGVVLGPGALWAAASIGVAVAVTTTAASAIGLAISLRCKSSTKASTLTVLALFALSGLYPAFAGALLGLAGAGRDAVWLLVTPAVVPFLIGAPPMLAIDSPEPLMVGSVAIGLTGYTAVAWLVSIAAVADFDRVCQRGRRRDKPAERAEGPEGGAAAA